MTGYHQSAARRDRLAAALEGGAIVLDAACGTRLIALGLDLKCDDPALWNLDHADAVYNLHRRDAAAGAQAIVTNTFGANRAWMARLGRPDLVEPINRRAVELARRAGGEQLLLLGSVGPTAARTRGAAAEQAAILADCGVDALLFETFGADQIEPVLAEVAQFPSAPPPLLVSLWEWPAEPEALARRLLGLGARALGMNCQPGVAAALAFARRLSAVVDCPLLVKPSAGPAADSDSTPAAFARAAPLLRALGVRLMGGCCGTDHRHVRALARACAALKRGSLSPKPGANR